MEGNESKRVHTGQPEPQAAHHVSWMFHKTPWLCSPPKGELRAQHGFDSLLSIRRERGIRDFADFFRELTRDLANVFKLFHVPFTERAHEIMDSKLHAHH